MSIIRMQEAFLSLGWSIEELDKDYGEDLLVRIFDRGNATPYTFYVQAKSVESLKRHTRKDGTYIRYPIDLEHLRHWKDFWDPVFLMLWDQETNTVYWDMIQDPELPLDMSGKRAKIMIPKDQRLDRNGLLRVRRKTIFRHARFQKEREGSEALVQVLQKSLDATIEYDPEGGLLAVVQNGKVQEITLFGELLQLTSQLAELRGSTVEEVLRDAFDMTAEVFNSIQGGRPFCLRSPDGRVIAQWNTVDEMVNYLDDLNERADLFGGECDGE
jgi:hypothetical protein